MSESWSERANCKEIPVEVFFSSKRADIRRAKAACMECPVRRECLEDSLKQQDRFGIFGGADHLRRRQALQIDADGHATISAKPLRCPLCGEKKIITNVKRRSWMKVTCSREECQLSWVAKRVVPRKPSEPKAEPNENVEPTV
jgi:WhiB family redox-sensing transcriptional regulator